MLPLATGDAVVSWPLVAWLAVASAAVSGIPTPGGFRERLLGAAAGALAAVAMFGAIYLVWFILLRHLTGKVRVACTLVTYFIFGGFRGYIIVLLLPAFLDIQLTQSEVVYRIFASTTTMPVFITIGTWTVALSRQSRARLAALEARRVEVAATLDRIQAETRSELDSTLGEIRRLITETEPRAKSVPLSEFNDRVVRPLSHELASRIPTFSPPTVDPATVLPPWKELWRTIDFHRNIQPLWTSLAVLLAWVGPVMTTFGLIGGVIGLAAFFTAWIPTLCALRWVLVALETTRLWIQVLAQIVLVSLCAAPAIFIVGKLVTPLLATRFDLSTAALIQAAEAVWFIAVCAAINERNRQSKSEKAELDAQLSWLEARARLISWHNCGQLARALHGPIQAEIIAALATSDWQYSPTEPAVGEPQDLDHWPPHATADYVESLVPRLSALLNDETADLNLAVESMVALWRGTRRIQFAITPAAQLALDQDQAATDLVISILQDAVSNAVHHGRATDITIEITAPDHHLTRVRVHDNGSIDPQSDSPNEATAGLGTAQLEACSLSWRRTYDPQRGTTLVARLPTLG